MLTNARDLGVALLVLRTASALGPSNLGNDVRKTLSVWVTRNRRHALILVSERALTTGITSATVPGRRATVLTRRNDVPLQLNADLPAVAPLPHITDTGLILLVGVAHDHELAIEKTGSTRN